MVYHSRSEYLNTRLPANWLLAKLPFVTRFASALHGLIAVTVFRAAPGQGGAHVAILTTPTRMASGISSLYKRGYIEQKRFFEHESLQMITSKTKVRRN